MKDTVLVVPSIREDSWNRFIEEWSRVKLFDHVDLILVEDNPEKTFKSTFAVQHYSWNEIDNELGKLGWIIPRRSDTIRSFGYYEAWRNARWKYIMTLDDDCYPPVENIDGFSYRDGAVGFLELHKQALTEKSRWFNTLNSVKPRGIPFYEIGKLDNVVINHGLWTNVLDYDAPTQLVHPANEKFSFDNRIVPQGTYFPMCGMNLMWRSSVTVLMYHLLMGRMLSTYSSAVDGTLQLPFDRFGDIWAGIIAKRICDLRGFNIATGTPYIHHDRASNPFANLKKEANGIEVNEKFWQHIDKFNDASGDLPFIYDRMGHHVSEFNDFPQHSVYFKDLGRAMIEWSHLFKG